MFNREKPYYEIEIKYCTPNGEEKYPHSDIIYEQKINSLPFSEIIQLINKPRDINRLINREAPKP